LAYRSLFAPHSTNDDEPAIATTLVSFTSLFAALSVLAVGGVLTWLFKYKAAQSLWLTISLAFVSSPTIDAFGVGTTADTFAAFGFTGMTTAQIQAGVLSAVTNDYLGYPTGGLSPLPAGKELNINFVMSTLITAPGNGDPEYYFVAIGTNTTSDPFLGQACLGCVRTSGGVSFPGNNHAIVGSILTDVIQGALGGLATTDAQRINLIAGTVSHEVGHALSLPHPASALANPGASTFSLMATGAAPTNMPNSQRVLDRAFGYTEFSQLITAIGVRDVSVPEPASLATLALGSVLIVLRARRRTRA